MFLPSPRSILRFFLIFFLASTALHYSIATDLLHYIDTVGMPRFEYFTDIVGAILFVFVLTLVRLLVSCSASVARLAMSGLAQGLAYVSPHNLLNETMLPHETQLSLQLFTSAAPKPLSRSRMYRCFRIFAHFAWQSKMLWDINATSCILPFALQSLDLWYIQTWMAMRFAGIVQEKAKARTERIVVASEIVVFDFSQGFSVPEWLSNDEEDIDKEYIDEPEEHTNTEEEQTSTALVLYASPSVARRSAELDLWVRIALILLVAMSIQQAHEYDRPADAQATTSADEELDTLVQSAVHSLQHVDAAETTQDMAVATDASLTQFAPSPATPTTPSKKRKHFAVEIRRETSPTSLPAAKVLSIKKRLIIPCAIPSDPSPKRQRTSISGNGGTLLNLFLTDMTLYSYKRDFIRRIKPTPPPVLGKRTSTWEEPVQSPKVLKEWSWREDVYADLNASRMVNFC